MVCLLQLKVLVSISCSDNVRLISTSAFKQDDDLGTRVEVSLRNVSYSLIDPVVHGSRISRHLLFYIRFGLYIGTCSFGFSFQFFLSRVPSSCLSLYFNLNRQCFTSFFSVSFAFLILLVLQSFEYMLLVCSHCLSFLLSHFFVFCLVPFKSVAIAVFVSGRKLYPSLLPHYS